MHDDRFEVRKLGTADAAALHRLLTAPSVLREFPTVPRGVDAAWFARYLAMADRPGTAMGFWGGLDAAGRLAAVVMVSWIGADRLFLGYATAPERWGQGLAPRAVASVLLEAQRLHPDAVVETSVEPDNPASVRVLEKLGFTALGERPYRGPSRSGAVRGPHYERRLDAPLADLDALAASGAAGRAHGMRR